MSTPLSIYIDENHNKMKFKLIIKVVGLVSERKQQRIWSLKTPMPRGFSVVGFKTCKKNHTIQRRKTPSTWGFSGQKRLDPDPPY